MESMNKGILHGTIIFAGMVIAYYGIRSMHQPMEATASIATCVNTQGDVENKDARLERCIALNKKLLISYKNEARDLQKLGLSEGSKPVQFARQQVEETAALLSTLENQVRNSE